MPYPCCRLAVFLVAIAGSVHWNDKDSLAWAHTADLQYGILFDFHIMRDVFWLGEEAASWQELEMVGIELLAVACRQEPRQNREFA